MTIAFVAQASAASSTGNSAQTSPDINSAGGNFAVVGCSFYRGAASFPAPTDSMSNTYSALTAKDDGSEGHSQLFYCESATVGSGHHANTGTVSNAFPCIFLATYSGVATSSSLDSQTGATTNSGSPLTVGTFTPAANGELIVTNLCSGNPSSSLAVNNSFGDVDTHNLGGNNEGGGYADKIQTTATTVTSLQWSWSGGASNAAATAAWFKAPSGGGSTTTLTLVAGSLGLSSVADQMAMAMPVVVGSLTLSGKIVHYANGPNLTTTIGNLTLTGQPAQLVAQYNITKADLALTGFAISFSVGQQITLNQGALTLTGYAVPKTDVMPVAVGALALTGYAVTFSKAQAGFVVAQGALRLAGYAVTLQTIVPWTPVSTSAGVWTAVSDNSDIWTPIG